MGSASTAKYLLVQHFPSPCVPGHAHVQVDAMTQTTQAAGAGGSEGGSTDASPPQAPASVQKRSASKH